MAISELSSVIAVSLAKKKFWGCGTMLVLSPFQGDWCEVVSCDDNISVDHHCRHQVPRAASGLGVRRQVKRENAIMVSYSISETRHAGDTVILLVGPLGYGTHLVISDSVLLLSLCAKVRLLIYKADSLCTFAF